MAAPQRLLVLAIACVAVSPAFAQQWMPGGRGQLPLDLDETEHLASGDFDGDGSPDLLVGNVGQNRLYLNDGTAVFRDATAGLPAEADYTWAMAVGDVDADGDLDFFTSDTDTNYFVSNIRLYRNDGAASFTSVPSPGIISAQVSDLALADVDGDRDLDLIVADRGIISYLSWGTDRLYLNDGQGNFVEASSRLPYVLDFSGSVAAGDVDGDGDLDLAFDGTGRTMLYLNDGSGQFTDVSATQMPSTARADVEMAFLDFDGDGDLDLAVCDRFAVFLLENDGTGTFADVTAGRLPDQLGTTSALAVGDVDGDGDVDLTVGQHATNLSEGLQNRLWLNDGRGSFTDATAAWLPVYDDSTRALLMEDLDGDGRSDLVTGNHRETNMLSLNAGDRLADASQPAAPLRRADANAVVVGDLDGDGALDAVVSTLGREESRLLLNDGFGRFRDQTAERMPGRTVITTTVALGDADGDGAPDLAFANPVTLYWNDGSGHFGTVAELPSSYQVNAMVFVDVDGDGDLDLVVATGFNFGPTTNRLFRNDGGRRFTEVSQSALPQISGINNDVVAADVDLDGDPDLVFGRLGEELLYLNDGLGHFVNATATHLPGGRGATVLAASDVDGDGDLDLWRVAQNRLGLYLNTAGVFRDVTSARVPTVTPTLLSNLAAGDVDGDGDADLVLATSGWQFGSPSEPNLVLVNDGNGFFSDATATMLPGSRNRSSAIALADFDRDGDLDLLSANYGTQSEVFWNLQRHLDAPRLPRRGHRWDLRISALAGLPGNQSAAALLSAQAAGPVLVPPFGWLGIDLTTAVALPPLAVSASGEASYVFQLPSNPALAGAAFFAQAIVLHGATLQQARLTNTIGEVVW